MPTPERTTLDAIVTAARELLERDGLAGVTMQAVAERVGVRAPSLYKRVQNRDTLVRLVAEATLADLAARLDEETDPVRLLDLFRAFGHERPAAFRLVMVPAAGMPVAGLEHHVAVSRPILRAAATLAGEEFALEAARTLTAWAGGFVSMELNGGFNLGGDVEAAWRFGVTRIVSALRSQPDDAAE